MLISGRRINVYRKFLIVQTNQLCFGLSGHNICNGKNCPYPTAELSAPVSHVVKAVGLGNAAQSLFM